MSRTTSSMGLRLWDQLTDPYNNAQLADNFAKIDGHDHTPGRGVQITTQGIANESITDELIVKGRVLVESESSYKEISTPANKEEVLASATRPTLVVTFFRPKLSTEEMVKYYVGGQVIAQQSAPSIATSQYYPFKFICPAGQKWMWELATGSGLLGFTVHYLTL